MPNEIALRNPELLPAPVAEKMKEWLLSPRRSYDSLPGTISHADIFNSDNPTLGQLARNIGRDRTRMIVSIAIENVNRLFRADRRMDPDDIAFLAGRIVTQYWYLKPEDIKKCFEGRRPKQFVLEGDSFLSWLAEYDLQRDRACEDTAANRKAEEERSSAGAISDKVYREILKARAESGDDEARQTLARYAKIDRMRTPEQQAEFDRRLNEIKLQRLIEQGKI